MREASPNVTAVRSAKVTKLSKAQKIQKVEEDITIENDVMKYLSSLFVIFITVSPFQAVQVTFDSITKGLKSITNKLSKITLNVHQGFYWYHSWGDEPSSLPIQASGAYIFRYM